MSASFLRRGSVLAGHVFDALLREDRRSYRFPGQIVSAEWVDREAWHIEASYPPDTPYAEVRRMAPTLLVDRFKLVSHVEQRALPVLLTRRVS